MSGSREEERRKLADIINHWNANRLDLFEISRPTEDLEFHGVMRFYFQDRVAGNFATKCIRVSSTATTQDVIETLAEKFRPDMRMLSSPKYSLYEVHVSGEERQLDLDEKPLVVQLNWNKDDREGRFVLKNENDILPKKSQSNGPEKEKDGVIQNFKRTLSKKEKKKEKKREKEFARIPDGDEQALSREDGENSRLAAEVYKDMPENSFTRTISNPEVVMKRRRQQKLEKRMQEFMSSDGRPDSGGTLRIYADSLKPNIPYKTILLSTRDTADFAVVEALEKYGLEKENPREYCIARCLLKMLSCRVSGALVFQLKKRPPDYQGRKGRKVDDKGLRGKDGSSSLPPEKLPYLVELSPGRTPTTTTLYRVSVTPAQIDDCGHVGPQLFSTDDTDVSATKEASFIFEALHQDKSQSSDPVKHTLRQTRQNPGAATAADVLGARYGDFISELDVDGAGLESSIKRQDVSSVYQLHLQNKTPFYIEDASRSLVLVAPHGSDSRDKPKLYRLQHSITEVGSDCTEDGAIQLLGPGILPHHCNLMHSEGMVTVTPHGPDADTFVDGQRVTETTVLRSGSTLQFGQAHVFKFVDPMFDQGGKREPAAMMRSRHKSGSQDISADRAELTLPAGIEFRDNSEDTFLSAIINYTNSSTVHFKLSPTYVLYMACRYVLSPSYRPDMSPSERTHKVIAIVNKMVSMMEGVIQADLNNYMPAFLDDPEEHNPQRPKIEDVLHTLTGAMSLLRRCRVNAALTIQLFSQLFHFINMWLFNKLVTDTESGLCCHYWGAILRQQLSHIEAWAEKQGLELAADCHLSRIVQATTLLTMDKYSMQDVPNIHNTCFKLNSLQLHALMNNYHCAPDEPYIPPMSWRGATAERFSWRRIRTSSCRSSFPRTVTPATWCAASPTACRTSWSRCCREPMRKEPEVVTVTLKKHNGMGLSIVAAKFISGDF
ncbi:Afadin [Larimichthys crocea]|uniref:Uncharacterized protein n=1 Tax=Larimichthys crocea TaxID=215358 RepID=A0ACD3R1L8_LARCR|nr:Afadin [Larimichthys crocea]